MEDPSQSVRPNSSLGKLCQRLKYWEDEKKRQRDEELAKQFNWYDFLQSKTWVYILDDSPESERLFIRLPRSMQRRIMRYIWGLGSPRTSPVRCTIYTRRVSLRPPWPELEIQFETVSSIS